jgi:hypothetical protein
LGVSDDELVRVLLRSDSPSPTAPSRPLGSREELVGAAGVDGSSLPAPLAHAGGEELGVASRHGINSLTCKMAVSNTFSPQGPPPLLVSATLASTNNTAPFISECYGAQFSVPRSAQVGAPSEDSSSPTVRDSIGVSTVLDAGVDTLASLVGAPLITRMLESSLPTVTGDPVPLPYVDGKNSALASTVGSRGSAGGGSAPPLMPAAAASAGVPGALSTEPRRVRLRAPTAGGLMNLALEAPFSSLKFQRDVVNISTEFDSELAKHWEANDDVKPEIVNELARRGGRPPRKLTLLPLASDAERTWAKQLRGSASSVAYPVTPAPPPFFGRFRLPLSLPHYTGSSQRGARIGPCGSIF